MRVVIDDNIPEREVRTDIHLVRFDHSSKHREWKQLVRQRRKLSRLVTTRDAYIIGGDVIVMTSDVHREFIVKQTVTLEDLFGW